VIGLYIQHCEMQWTLNLFIYVCMYAPVLYVCVVCVCVHMCCVCMCVSFVHVVCVRLCVCVCVRACVCVTDVYNSLMTELTITLC